MPQYIYDIFCWNTNPFKASEASFLGVITGVQRKLVLFGTTVENAKEDFIRNYDQYATTYPILFGYTNYKYVYRYEYESTGIRDSRNHMIFRPLYPYDYTDLLTLVREREPCSVIPDNMIVL